MLEKELHIERSAPRIDRGKDGRAGVAYSP